MLHSARPLPSQSEDSAQQSYKAGVSIRFWVVRNSWKFMICSYLTDGSRNFAGETHLKELWCSCWRRHDVNLIKKPIHDHIFIQKNDIVHSFFPNKTHPKRPLELHTLNNHRMFTRCFYTKATLPETNISPLKIGGWETILSFWVSAPVFRDQNEH